MDLPLSTSLSFPSSLQSSRSKKRPDSKNNEAEPYSRMCSEPCSTFNTHQSPNRIYYNNSEELDKDDPEDRRVVTAFLRHHVRFENEDNISIDESNSIDVAVANSRHKPNIDGKQIEQHYESLGPIASGSRSVPAIELHLANGEDETERSTITGTLSSNTYRGPFWEELESLQEENSALRHQNEVYKLQGQLTTLKLRLQDFTGSIFFQTAFGYQSYQIDKSVQGVIDEACLKGISSLNDVLCIPAFVFQYSPVENITFSMKEHNSDTLITQLNALTLDENTAADGCQCGHEQRCTVAGLSRATTYLTDRRILDEPGSSWSSIFEQETQTDMESIRRVKVWFDDIKARFDEIGLLREPSILEKRYFVNSDIVVKLRLRRKCGLPVPGTVILTSFFLANRLLILGIHSARLLDIVNNRSPQPFRMEHQAHLHELREIQLRSDLLNVLGRIAQTTVEKLKTVRNLFSHTELRFGQIDTAV